MAVAVLSLPTCCYRQGVKGGADTSVVLSGQGAKHMPNSSCSSGCMRAQGVLGCALGEGSFGAMYRNNLNQAVVGCLS